MKRIRHIVLFRLDDFAEGASKEKNLFKMKELLETLPSKIPQIREYEVGINLKPSKRASDISLTSSFDSLEDLEIYIEHSEHQKVAEFVLKVRSESRVIDYEYKI